MKALLLAVLGLAALLAASRWGDPRPLLVDDGGGSRGQANRHEVALCRPLPRGDRQLDNPCDRINCDRQDPRQFS